MRNIVRIFKVIILCFIMQSVFASENIFYVLHNREANHVTAPSTLNAINMHNKTIDMIISQAYSVNSNGDVTGFINPDLIKLSRQRSIKLLAMVTNKNFDSDEAHSFLQKKTAQYKVINTLINTCKVYKLAGVQFDFEMIDRSDKEKLTQFFRMAAQAFHTNHLIVSFAIPPVLTNGPFPSAYYARLYQKFGGAYDLKELGKHSDFITVMTYDQHIGRMAPGPIAGVPWMEAVIKHTLRYIPAEKISLGIPTYSGIWFTGPNAHGSKTISLQNNSISYEKMQTLLMSNKAQIQWDNINKINYAIYNRNWLNQYIFIENANSFKSKLSLSNKYRLKGISVFRIGTEDPKIWTLLDKSKMS